MRGLGPPMPTTSWSFLGASKGRTHHHRVCTTGDRACHVTGTPNSTIRDHVDVATARLIHVVAACRSNIGDRRRHGSVDAQGLASCVGCSPAKANQNTCSARTHQMQGGGVGGDSANDDGNIKLIDKAFEVERLCTRRDMLGRHRCSADDEEINTSLDNSAPVALGALGRKPSCHHDSRIPDVLETFGDEIGLDRCRINLLKPSD